MADVFILRSDEPGYGPALGSILTGGATLVGERYDEEGRRVIAVREGRLRANESGSGEEAGQIIIGPEFFVSAMDDYTDWREAWWREAIQNSLDAGATEVNCSVEALPDNTYRVTCEDNGTGMSKDVLRNVFMRFKGTLKQGASTGGFGEAKRLLLLPWLSYEVHTQDTLMNGSGMAYKTVDTAMRRGTRISVVMPGDRFTSHVSAVAYIGKCYAPRIKFTVSRDGDSQRVEAKLNPGKVVGTLAGVAEVRHGKEALYRHSILVRIKNPERGMALAMFSEYVDSDDVPGQLVVDIVADSVNILTSNRDAFRKWGRDGTDLGRRVSQELSVFKNDLAQDAKRVLRRGKQPERFKYIGTGKFVPELAARKRRQDRVLSALGDFEPQGKRQEVGHNEVGAHLGDSQMRQISEAIESIERDEEARAEGPSAGNAMMPPGYRQELLSSIAFRGAAHVESALRQMAWEPDFYLHSEIDGFRIPARFKPESMTYEVRRLVRLWTEVCRYVLMLLNCGREFGVGLIFSDESAAAFLKSGEDGSEEWLLLNPYNMRKSGHDLADRPLLGSKTDDDMALLFAMAVHEVTHMVDNVGIHNESFATALTYNIARTFGYEKEVYKLKRVALAAEREVSAKLRGQRKP